MSIRTAAVAGLLVGACAPEGTFIDVTVLGRAPQAARLVLRSQAPSGTETERSLDPPTDAFVVGIRAPTSGSVQLALRSVDREDCSLQEGRSTVDVSAGQRSRATLRLASLPAPSCSLRVEAPASLNPKVKVSSDPPGIDCQLGCTEPCCSARFHLGDTVSLQLAGLSADERLGNWLGACDGRGDTCKVTIEDRQATVALNLMPTPVCVGGGFCWSHPSPQGASLNGLYAAPDGALVAVGDGGAVLRVIGEHVEQLSSGFSEALFGVCGEGPTLTVVGARGLVLRTAGSLLVPLPRTGAGTLLRVACAGAAYAVGTEGLFRLGPAGHARLSTAPLRDVFAAGPGELWAAGVGGVLHLVDGSLTTLTHPALPRPRAITGDGRGTIFVASDDPSGVVARLRDGRVERLAQLGSGVAALAVGADGALWAVGDQGTTYRVEPGGSATPRWAGPLSLAAVTNSVGGVYAVGLSGTLRRLDADGVVLPRGRLATLNSVFAATPTRAVAVGDSGTILAWDGRTWTPQASGVDGDLASVRGRGPDDLWVVGHSGELLHYDGKAWRRERTGLPEVDEGKAWLSAVWPEAGGGVTVAGWGLLLRRDGAGRWRRVPEGGDRWWTSVWGSPRGALFAVSSEGHVLRGDGERFVEEWVAPGVRLHSIAGSGEDEVWTVGEASTALHLTARGWSRVATGLADAVRLYEVFVGPADEVWIVGAGVVLRGNSVALAPLPLLTDTSYNAVSGVLGRGPLPGRELWIVGLFGTILRQW